MILYEIMKRTSDTCGNYDLEHIEFVLTPISPNDINAWLDVRYGNDLVFVSYIAIQRDFLTLGE